MKKSMEIISRFERHIERIPESGCWLWMGALRGGYGRTVVGSRTDKTRRSIAVHRALFEKIRGPIVEGLDLDHLCRVRCCVNPFRLEAVTRRVNILRGVGMGARYAPRTHCKQGHELTGTNVRLTGESKWRRCLICKRISRNLAYRRNGK